jgi:hypothetical protein
MEKRIKESGNLILFGNAGSASEMAHSTGRIPRNTFAGLHMKPDRER